MIANDADFCTTFFHLFLQTRKAGSPTLNRMWRLNLFARYGDRCPIVIWKWLFSSKHVDDLTTMNVTCIECESKTITYGMCTIYGHKR